MKMMMTRGLAARLARSCVAKRAQARARLTTTARGLGGDRVYMVQRKASLLCHSEVRPTEGAGAEERHVHYAIGFASAVLARHVMYCIPPEPQGGMGLRRSASHNVTSDVNTGLNELGMPNVSGSVTVDAHATLWLPKLDPALPPALNDGMFHLTELPMEEFLMFPFDRNMGILLAYTMQDETDSQMVLHASLVEPANATEAFRRALPRLMS